MYKGIFAGLALLMLVMPGAPGRGQTTAEAAPAAINWLAGAWRETKADSWTEEFWSAERGDLVLGAGRSGHGKKLASFEHMRIIRAKDGQPLFIAQPFGTPPTEFRLIASGPGMAEFTNPANDYPQRVKYWRDGRFLMAEISQLDGSRRQSWRYAPMGSE